MFGKRNIIFLSLLFYFCCWAGAAQGFSQQSEQKNDGTVQVQNLSGSEAELKSLVRSMHSELMNLESALELSVADRDALFAMNQKLTLEAEELRRANKTRYQFGVLTGVALTVTVGALVAALCYQGFVSVK